MPTIPPAVIGVLSSLAAFVAIAIVLDVLRRRGIDPVTSIGARIDAMVPRAAAAAPTGGAA